MSEQSELMAVAVQQATTAANLAALTETVKAMSGKLDALHVDFNERRGMEKLVRGAYALIGGIGGSGLLIIFSKLTGVPLPR